MKQIPGHFSLVKEHPSSYELHDSRDDSRFHVAKNALNLAMHAKLSNIKKYSDGGIIDDPRANPEATPDNPSGTDNTPMQLPDPSAVPGIAQTDALPANPSAPGVPAAAEMTSIPSPAAAPVATPVDQQPSMYDNYEKAINNSVAAQTRAGNAAAGAWNGVADKMSGMRTANDIMAEHQAKDAELEKAYLDKSIDPNRYWNDKGTMGKLAAGIGMIFSGAGAGMSGQENMAVKAINASIDRDIAAQKNDQDKAMNLWKMNREATKNDMDADILTRNQMLTAVEAKAKGYAASTGGPDAALKAAPLLLDIQRQKQLGYAMMGLRNGQSDEASYVNGMGAMQQMNPAYAKELQSKYLPGVGVAKVPPAEADRQAFASFNELNRQLNRAKEFAASNGTTIPGTAANQQANDIQNQIQLQVGKLASLNRINEFEAKKYTDMVGNPGAFRTKAATQSFDDMKTWANDRKQSLMDNLGVTPFANRIPTGGGAPQAKPGTVIQIRGRPGNWVVGPDGNTLTPAG